VLATQRGRANLWYMHNGADTAVYFAYVRNVADGRFFQRNLFGIEDQGSLIVNLFFNVLGWTARVTGLSVPVIMELSRLAVGLLLIRAVWWLVTLVVEETRARRTALVAVCFFSGLGWTWLFSSRAGSGPPDFISPVVNTFYSVLFSSLFTVSLLLMVGVLGWAWRSEVERKARYAVASGVCAMLLGNIHSYDILTVVAIWLGVLAAAGFAKKLTWGTLGRVGIVAGFVAIALFYQWYSLRAAGVLEHRDTVPTLTAPPLTVLLAFGLMVPLGLYAAWKAKDRFAHPEVFVAGSVFLLVWFGVNLLLGYAPVNFQRKLLLGSHIPIAILAGVGLAALTSAMQGMTRAFAWGTSVLLLSLTNLVVLREKVRFVLDEPSRAAVRPYLTPGEVDVIAWLQANTAPTSRIQAMPEFPIAGNEERRLTDGDPLDITLPLLIPGLTGRAVYAAHWGETPTFPKRLKELYEFAKRETSDVRREAWLRDAKIDYLVVNRPAVGVDAYRDLVPFEVWLESPPPYLRRVFRSPSDPDAAVFEVVR